MAGSKRELVIKMKASAFVLCNLLFPILAGTVFYYFFCPEVIFVQAADAYLPFSYHIRLNMDIMAVRIVRFYLMDFLWAYSLTFLVCTCLNNDKKWGLILLFVFELLMELLQLHPEIKGTFDFRDLAVEVCADFFAIVIWNRRMCAKISEIK